VDLTKAQPERTGSCLRNTRNVGGELICQPLGLIPSRWNGSRNFICSITVH